MTRTVGPPPGRDLVWVTAAFTLLTLALAYPLRLHPASAALPLGGDTRLFLWTLGWDVHAITHRPWAVFDANIFAPERLTLAYSENCLGSALVAAPFLRATRNPLLAMNAVVLISCVLCGVGTYLLGRQLGLSRAASLAAGIVFAFAPPRFLRLGQLHLAPVQWVPFCLAYAHRYLAEGRSTDARIAAVFFTLQALTSGHGGLFVIVAILCLVGWRAARREPLRLLQLPRDLGVTGGACLLLLLAFTLPYMIVQREQGLVRTLQEARDWSPNLASYFASPSTIHRAVLSRLPWAAATPKAVLFPGILPLLLAPVGIWAAVRDRERRSHIGLYLVILLVGFWLSLGPDFGLYLLAYNLPAANFIRVPSRYVTLALLGLAIVAAAGLDFFLDRLTPRLRPAVAVMLCVWLVAEFNVMPLNAVRYDMQVPAADRWLNTRQKPFTVAEVPVVDPRRPGPAASAQSVYMMHSTAHWQKTVHGYSGFEPPGHTALYRELLRFPDDPSLETLTRFGVDYVVVHESYYRPGEWAAVRERLATYDSRLSLIYRDGESRVYALKKAGS